MNDSQSSSERPGHDRTGPTRTAADERPIDLSALDPARDELRWERLVRSVAERAVAVRRERLTVGHQLTRWARPAVAFGLVAAAASWIIALAPTEAPIQSVAESPERPADALVRWTATGELPTTARMLEVLGGSNAEP